MYAKRLGLLLSIVILLILTRCDSKYNSGQKPERAFRQSVDGTSEIIGIKVPGGTLYHKRNIFTFNQIGNTTFVPDFPIRIDALDGNR